ncbi:hypothetical protein SAMN05443246_0891 [Paenibacillus sp. GP183]|nr:hypothetical protein SAMN05443246_0891 [Paenibacillus sp. GP183]
MTLLSIRYLRPGGDTLMISNPELVADACDESRFDKSAGGDLAKVRAFAYLTCWINTKPASCHSNVLFKYFLNFLRLQVFNAWKKQIAFEGRGDDFHRPLSLVRLTHS